MSKFTVEDADFAVVDEGRLVAKRGVSPYTVARVEERVWPGHQVLCRTTLTKAQTGTLGEDLVAAYLGPPVRTLNFGRTNVPIDLRFKDQLIEVKSGLVSNKADGQKWRATIGQPAAPEQAWQDTLSADQKRAWNAYKKRRIMGRKYAAVKQIGAALGVPTVAKTYCTIINPDTRTFDLFVLDGFHQELRWTSELLATGYAGTFRYTKG